MKGISPAVTESAAYRQRDRAQSGVTAAVQDLASEPHPAATWSRRRYGGVVVAGMGVFFVYTGLEVSHAGGSDDYDFCRCRGSAIGTLRA